MTGKDTSPATDARTDATNIVPDQDANRSTTPSSERFRQYIASGWAEREEVVPALREQAPFAAARREKLSATHAGERIIVAAGALKQRSNDTEYPFRAHTAFSWLTGWGSDSEPDAVLVMAPLDTPGIDGLSHTATLYFRERAGRDSDEFYANSTIGEFWIGPRPSLAQVAADLGIATVDLSELSPEDLALAELPLSEDLARDLSEMRLVKDEWEIAEMRKAIAATALGFADIARVLPSIAGNVRGERLVEGAFSSRARLEGNGVGYDTIAASGAHACILHWTTNDGTVNDGDLILIDAGVELDSYYTADITRTIPVSGTFSPVQRDVYEAVRAAADAAFAIVKPGIRFKDIHAAAMAVIAEKTAAWGMLPVSAEEAKLPDNQHHRRYMVHGTSHHLGLDVHDCSQARRDMYMDGILEPGMIFTIEPGLYFQPDDLTVPAEFRGIGVRIEDDILVTATGAENLSAGIPRTADEVEKWVRPMNA
ncbi:aminopeptidase P family protein [Alpinimonas psychrophila]|uniref:Xaa-Pro aminopeptidase n=1 Tax=Alpinimonas psychrophila TaxID=748908 RepID=A0A7W3JS18_9MICO|nr:aminopeptidase P family protein [Alpinimonas psychrophila]MBA8828193.1 Xaa-Pro aminopeptidase [Alpinimonas psychrophila]